MNNRAKSHFLWNSVLSVLYALQLTSSSTSPHWSCVLTLVNRVLNLGTDNYIFPASKNFNQEGHLKRVSSSLHIYLLGNDSLFTETIFCQITARVV